MSKKIIKGLLLAFIATTSLSAIACGDGDKKDECTKDADCANKGEKTKCDMNASPKMCVKPAAEADQ